jgi:hypothetical protein
MVHLLEEGNEREEVVMTGSEEAKRPGARWRSKASCAAPYGGWRRCVAAAKRGARRKWRWNYLTMSTAGSRVVADQTVRIDPKLRRRLGFNPHYIGRSANCAGLCVLVYLSELAAKKIILNTLSYLVLVKTTVFHTISWIQTVQSIHYFIFFGN